jgi:hypothetical protein
VASNDATISLAMCLVDRAHGLATRGWFAARAAAGGAASPDDVGARLLVLLDGALNGAAVFRSPEAAAVAQTMAVALLDALLIAQA